jgi:serine/threonine protein kinase
MAVEYIGRQLGNYQLIRLLGDGGFAEVYLGQHVYLGTQAAIKVMRVSMSNDDLESFRSEARTVARLVHPNIIRVLEFGVTDGIPFLVMDFASNGTLRQRHPREQAIPLPTIIPYVKQVASALQYAHDEKLVHRDVKPENMLLGRQNEVLLSDFGIALMAQNTRDQSLTNAAGTIAYMSPEQIQGKPRPASDQYSLGIVVYEWLSGIRPFQGSFTEIVSQQLAITPLPLREHNPALSPGVEQVVLKALAKDPKERFATIRDFAQALEQANQLDDATIVVQRPLQPAIQAAIPASEPAIVATSPTILPTPSVKPLATPPAAPPPVTTPPPRAAARFSAVAPTLYTYRGHTAAVNTVAWSPDGKYFTSGSDDQTAIVWDATTGNMLGTYRGHSGKVTSLLYAPGNIRIASSSEDKTIQVWNAATGSPLLTYRGHSKPIRSISWSPDEQFVASGGLDEDIHIWNATTGLNTFIYRGHVYSVNVLAWSPDGRLIASAGEGKAVQLWDAATGRLSYAYRGHNDAVNTLAWSPDSRLIASGGVDKTVQIWDIVTGYNIFPSRNQNSKVTATSWSPDGSSIASASADGNVQLWDTASGRKAYNNRLSSPGRTLAWSPDNQRLAIGCEDGTVQVWQTA